MNLLLVEPYHGGSHRAWAEGYARNSSHRVRLITHPGRWWRWRMRGSAVTLARALADLDGWQPDLVVASDMIDLAQFRGLARRFIGDPPTVLYFHESQLTYATPTGTATDTSYAFTNWVSAYAADHVLFNSGYHLDVFFESLPRMLRDFPDQEHLHLVDEVRARSGVLPVGVDLSWARTRARRAGTPRLLWNHRWDFDKGPDTFAEAVAGLLEAGEEFELALLGPRPPSPPRALMRIREIASDRIVHDAEAPEGLYRKVISECDIVLSTALQEFFGVSVVEAAAAGCRPVLPNRLSYPWLIPAEHHHAVLYEEGELLAALLRALRDPVPPDGLPGSLMQYSWDRMAPTYDRRFEELSGTR